MSTDVLRREMIASGLFDPAFYRSTYGPFSSDSDALDHFVASGLASGHLPSAGFDPVLYRLTSPDCGCADPILHYLQRGRPVVPRLEDFFRRELQRIELVKTRKTLRGPEELQRHLAYRGEVALARRLPFEIDAQPYCIEVPAPEFFLDRLRHNEPFSFARLPHGFWDALSLLEGVAADLPSTLTWTERRALANRICLAARPGKGVFVEGFFHDVLALIPLHRADGRFFKAVAFKGYPTPDEDIFPKLMDTQERIERLRLLRGLFDPRERLYDASLWKRLAYSGHILSLPAACRDRHVILVGPDYLQDLDRRWGLARFTYLNIPRQLTHKIRWQVLQRIRDVLSDLARTPEAHPVVMFQCGGSLAYWLISHLFDEEPAGSYIDLGQAVNIWFGETEIPQNNWFRVYRRLTKQQDGASSEGVAAQDKRRPAHRRRVSGTEFETL